MSRASGLYWQHAHHQTGSICTATCSQAKWDRCVNTRIRKVEVQTSAARLPADWNIATGSFLRRCGPPPLPLPPPGQSRCLFATVLLQQHDTVPTPVLVGKSVAAQPPKLWCRASIVGRHVLMRQRHGTCVQQAARAWCMNSASGWGMVPELSKRLGHADVYDRLTPKGRKPTLYTMVITQLVSGFWHGIFPGSPLPPIHPRLPDSCQLAVCVYGGQRCRPPVRAASPPG